MLGLSIHKYENLKLTHKVEGTRKGGQKEGISSKPNYNFCKLTPLLLSKSEIFVFK